MSKTKTLVNVEEVDEIINLYIESQGGIVPQLKYKAIADFNSVIANNDKYKREDSGLFTLYKYNFWGGSYKGEYNYGKQRIIELNNKNKVQVVGREFDSEMADVITLVNDLHKKPQELTKHLISIFQKERKKLKDIKIELKITLETNSKLEKKIENLEEGITNLLFQSQDSKNSLNNMMNLSKSADSICYDELKNMFGDTNRFERLQHHTMDENNSVINIEDLNRLKRLKEIEEDGF